MKLRWSRIAKAAISGQTIAEIATTENVSERQIYRILAKDAVKVVIDAAGKQMVRSATVILQRGSESSARALVEMADGTRKASTARVAAARAVIEHTSGRPLQRAELTGKDGKDLIPATKEDAIGALRAVIPAAALAGVPVAPAEDTPGPAGE